MPELLPKGIGSVRCLLNLTDESHVLCVGTEFQRWSAGCSRALVCSSIDDSITRKTAYDLIALSSAVFTKKKAFDDAVTKLKSALSQEGALVVFAHNRFSFRKIRELMSLRGIFSDALVSGYKGFSKGILRSSFSHVYSYLSFPDLERPFEMVAPESPFLEIPHYQNRIKKWILRRGIYHLFHDGFVFICKNGNLFEEGVFFQYGKIVKSYLKTEMVDLSLDRFDFRERGALVLFLKEKLSSKQFVARIVSHHETKAIVKKNHSFLSWLHSHEGIPEYIKKTVPVPLPELSFRGNSVFTETLLPGTLAWKVNSRQLSERIYQESINFTLAMISHTKEKHHLNREYLQILFNDDMQRIETSSACSSEFRSHFVTIVDMVIDNVDGKDIWMTAAHGDYGFGNILVDGRTGRLKGVIDWDTGRKEEFPAVDLINMQIQKERIERGTGFLASVEHLLTDDCLGLPAVLAGELKSLVEVDRPMLKVVFSIAVIRYISRAVQYPVVFRKESEDYYRVMKMVKGLL